VFATQKVRSVALAVALIFGGAMAVPRAVAADDGGGRKLKSEAKPVYPELAKHMNIGGTVKVEVTIAPNGTVKSTKVLGGHPLLANAAEDAAKKRRYEPGPNEDKEIVVYNFSAAQ
jgi:TonB family protein